MFESRKSIAGRESLVEAFANFVVALNNEKNRFFTSIGEFSNELAASSEERVFWGVYCALYDLLLYSDDQNAHSILDFHISSFLRAQSLSCPQHDMLYHNVCNRTGKKTRPTTFPGIYISTFAGKNLRTFGGYYLPKPEEDILLDHIR